MALLRHLKLDHAADKEPNSGNAVIPMADVTVQAINFF